MLMLDIQSKEGTMSARKSAKMTFTVELDIQFDSTLENPQEAFREHVYNAVLFSGSVVRGSGEEGWYRVKVS